MVAITCLSSSHKLHNKMVWKILRAKILFFDSTTIGTVLTRFSKDLGISDFLLPQLSNFFLIMITKVLVLMVFIIVVVPWNILILILSVIPMYYIRKVSIVAQNDCQRLDSMSKGPLNTRYSSAIDGITSIRAYKRPDYFIEGFIKDSDLNANAKFSHGAVLRWQGTRIDL